MEQRPVAGTGPDSPVDGSVDNLGPGAQVCCRLLAQGTARVAEAIVVKHGPWQSVVACPGECALASTGFWADSAEEGAWQSFVCPAANSEASCLVVFYSLPTEALATTALPGAANFRTVDGSHVFPATESLLELFYVEAGGDSIHIGVAAPSGEVSAQGSWQDVRIGARWRAFQCNSVIVVPDFLTQTERHTLIDAADRGVRGGISARQYAHEQGLSRFPAAKLDLEAQLLSSSIMSEKVMELFEQKLPHVSLELFGRSSRLKEMKFSFSPGEPAVNRYMVGGGISPHTDKKAVTINVLLSDAGAFTGGGTCFWPQEPDDAEENADAADVEDDMILLRPPPGTALLFNGTVTHAGRAVTSGVRHAFVASFSLWSPEDD